jgi:hypothetical protein
MRVRTVYCVFALGLLLTSCNKPAPEKTNAAVAGTINRPGVEFRAEPNPIIVQDDSQVGQTTLYWETNIPKLQIRLGAPGGRLFGLISATGNAPTGKWVTNGMTFYLQDGTASDPTTASATVATVVVSVK